ncbi:MAG TPA: hypothetical protein VGJ45_06680 [Pseudonocardiaceae bacterium]
MIVVFPDASGKVPTSESLRPASPDTFYEHGCPGGATQTWYCFFADRDYLGRTLQFKDCSPDGVTQTFSSWNFTNQTSSWVNTYGIEDPVEAYIGAWNGGNNLWVEPPDDSSDYVGDANNDKAQYFDSYC